MKLVKNIAEMTFWQTWTWADLTLIPVPSSIYGMIYYAIFNGVLTTIAIFILPKIFERLFDVVSPITLYSLDEHEHPLLERMHKEATGTYEHCKAVADMAYDAADAIGADKILARVAGRFHDIGKLVDPLCFAENCFGSESPHTTLSPYESSERIRMHIRSGEELGRKYHLPKPIIEAIRTHHGNDVVFFFFNKATKEATEKGLPLPSEASFSYDAPLPHRKEAVIVEFADICEAASRAEFLRKENGIDFATVSEFVHKLILGKLAHHQLADADMTLAELTLVCDSLCKSLCVKYHARPKYEKTSSDSSVLDAAPTQEGMVVSETKTLSSSNLVPEQKPGELPLGGGQAASAPGEANGKPILRISLSSDEAVSAAEEGKNTTESSGQPTNSIGQDNQGSGADASAEFDDATMVN